MVKGEECVVVTCYFAAGSNALGCVVHMRIVNTYTSQHLHSWQFNVTQDPDLLSGAVHVPLEPKASAVDVVVYDLTATGRVGFLSIPPHITLSANGECTCSLPLYIHVLLYIIHWVLENITSLLHCIGTSAGNRQVVHRV